MLFLILAVLSSAMVSIVMRVSSDKVTANLSMLAVNYLICSFLGALYTGFQLWPSDVPGFTTTLGLGAIDGALYLSGFAFLQANVRKNGVVLSSVFMKLGLLIPILLSLVVFHEIPTAAQAAGFILAVIAIVLINLKKDTGAKGFGMGLILLLLLGGCCDSMAKIYEVFGEPALSEQFLLYTFVVAFALCVGMVIWKKECPGVWELMFGILISVPNFFSAKFLLLALTKLPAVVVYPSFSVGTMLLVTLTGVAVFRERLSKVQWIAMGAIVAALILLNI